MRTSKELQIGKAGEYLVCADIILKNMIVFLSEQGLPYDILIDTGKKLLRCQVKTTTGLREIPQRTKKTYAYIFNIKRCGKNHKERYSLNEVDLFALVCLDTKKIGYIVNKEMPSTINIRDDRIKNQYYDEQGKILYKIVMDYRQIYPLKTQTQIAKELNMHVSEVNRMLKNDYKPYETNARYFSDFEKDDEWFQNL